MIIQKNGKRESYEKDQPHLMSFLKRFNETHQTNDIFYYLDFGMSDGMKYINAEVENTFFINSCNLATSGRRDGYYYLTANSFNPRFKTIDFFSKEDNKKRQHIFNKYFKVEKDYKIKKDGYIVIFLNNFTGFFKETYNLDYEKVDFIKDSNLLKEEKVGLYNLVKLVETIRKYNQTNEIVLRVHPKTFLRKNVMNCFKLLNLKVDNKSFKDTYTDINHLLKNTYCAFIQNTKLLFEIVAKGIPVFSLGIYQVNYFPEICITDLSYLERLKTEQLELPNRHKFLKKQMKHIIFKNDFKDKYAEKYLLRLIKQIQSN